MQGSKSIQSALESMMFVWGVPLEAKAAAELFNVTEEKIIEEFEQLKKFYDEEGRGIRLRRVNKSYQFVTASENEDYIYRLCTPVKKKKLSQSALEVLAIIAYRQPITRSEMEGVRGIKCDRVLEGLMRKELIEEKGRSQGIGRPILYGTTDQFLKYFGLESLKDLPDIVDIEEAIEEERQYDDSVMANQITLEEMSKKEFYDEPTE